jgi:hypothetical protein
MQSTAQQQPTVQQPSQADPSSVTQAYTPPADDQANANTQTWHGSYGNQMVDAANTLNQMRADHLKNMPLDQKLELVLKKTTEAEKVAYRALQSISDFDSKLDRVFKDLSGQIARVAGGKQPQQPDPPGSSIWDEDDPESIFGR